MERKLKLKALPTDRSVSMIFCMAPEADEIPALREPDSREKILEVAEGLFAYGGYSGVGMRQLASTVGLSKSSLFHHFPSKLDLYGAVLDGVLVRIAHGLDRASSETGDPRAQLAAWIDAVVGTLSEDVPAGRLMMRALVDEEPFPAISFGQRAVAEDAQHRELMSFEVRLAEILDRFSRLIEAGIADGTFRPVSIGDTILSVVGSIVFHFASGDLGDELIGESIFSRPAVERRRREVSEFILRGLLA